MQTRSSSTRDQILNLLKINKRMTVTELAKELSITEMAVRRHLNTLERDHFIETELVRQSMGRPANVFRLAEKGEELFPRNYKTMTIEFLEDIEELEGRPMVEKLFVRREERLKNRYSKQLESSSFAQKVKQLTHIQNENGYMAALQDNDGEYILTEFNCPIAEVAGQYPIACDCELRLFRNVLGTDQVTCTKCAAKGDDICEYRIKKPE
ncbi:helix-turn-helix transcriptional regulator [Bacillus marinisedimentorum]|uniref:helix-turn-helix transcriptional regulator n=1 Tax=Bacillus marinisedimentorum TaxID=1821260 RepID=UPI000872C16B|nr:metalloregulator ArsR/SmtB family transcription factor [Bacillus marinisedimentorum]